MTVRDLIQKLLDAPMDATVTVTNIGDDGDWSLEEVKIGERSQYREWVELVGEARE